MSLILSKQLYQELRAHGEETYPHECCGILLGKASGDDLRVTALTRAGNTRTDSPHNRYNIGFYHSHPDHPAQWSSTDLAEAHWFDCAYVITAVEKGAAQITNSFLLNGISEDEKAFVPQFIAVE